MATGIAGRVRTAARSLVRGASPDTGGWPRLLEVPEQPGFVQSGRRINRLQSGMARCTAYLEIGVQFGYTFRDVHAPFKWGVDPAQHFYLGDLPAGVRFSLMTSDAFFEALPDNVAFDLAFLDGLHEWTQTYRDLLNTLNHASPGAIVVIDDVLPDDEYSAIPDIDEAYRRKREAGSANPRWQGDVYKVLLAIADHHPELEVVLTGTSEPGDNPQAFVWRRSGAPRRYDLSVVDERRGRYDSLAFTDVFDDAARQERLRTVPEDRAVAKALHGSAVADADGSSA